MIEKRFELDDDDEYLIDNKTGKLYDACGGGDGLPFVINEYHELEKENEQLKEENEQLKKIHDVALELVEEATQHNLWKLRTFFKEYNKKVMEND